MTATPPVPLPAPPAPPTPSTSKTAVGLGVGGAGLAAWVIDRVLLDGGDQAAAVLTKIGPVLGPVWASWPLLALVIVLAYLAVSRWQLAQQRQAEANAAAAAASATLTHGVGEIATGLTGLRREVHELRDGLAAHAAQTDQRLGALSGEVVAVRGRVEKLERPKRTRPPTKKPRDLG